MKSKFESEQAANDYKAQHQLFGRVAEKITGTKYWALNFPIPSKADQDSRNMRIMAWASKREFFKG